MSTIIVFALTLGQLAGIVVGYFAPMPKLFDALVVYGSPPFFIMNALNSNSVAFESHPFFPLLAFAHVIKYLCLCRSQFVVERHTLHYLSVIFEVVYLVIAGYYLNAS